VPTITGQTHNAKIWVWIDYRKIENNQPTGTWTRAEITTTPAVSSSPTSTATLVSNNNKGFWLNGVTGNYSATITVSLTNISANTKFNWCAYTSDCPPGAYYTTPTNVNFKGTLPFYITYNDGAAVTVTSKTNYTPASGKTITSVTDATACPGIIAAVTTGNVTGANSVATNYSNVYILNGSTTNAPISERGFVYSSSNSSPTTATGTKLTVSAGTGTMSYNWTNTTYSTTFYIRAYAISNGIIMYGNPTNFKVWGQWYAYVSWYGVCYGTYGYTSSDGGWAFPCTTSWPNSTTTSQWHYDNFGAGSICNSLSGGLVYSAVPYPYDGLSLGYRCSNHSGSTRNWQTGGNRQR
jgi:hypothetical protein